MSARILPHDRVVDGLAARAIPLRARREGHARRQPRAGTDAGVLAQMAHRADHGLRAGDVRGLGQAVFVQQHHVNVDVAGMELAVGDRLLLVADLNHLLHGHEHFADELPHLLGLEPLLNALFDLLLLARERMDDKPLAFHAVP